MEKNYFLDSKEYVDNSVSAYIGYSFLRLLKFFCLLFIACYCGRASSSKAIDLEPESDIKITGEIIEYDPNKNISIVRSGAQDAKVIWTSKTHQNVIFSKKIIVSHQNTETDKAKKINNIHTITLEGPVHVRLDPFSKGDKIIDIKAQKCVYQADIIDCRGEVDISVDNHKIRGDQVHFDFKTLLFEVKSEYSHFAEAQFDISQKSP